MKPVGLSQVVSLQADPERVEHTPWNSAEQLARAGWEQTGSRSGAPSTSAAGMLPAAKRFPALRQARTTRQGRRSSWLDATKGESTSRSSQPFTSNVPKMCVLGMFKTHASRHAVRSLALALKHKVLDSAGVWADVAHHENRDPTIALVAVRYISQFFTSHFNTVAARACRP